jgi:hypothetical protein
MISKTVDNFPNFDFSFRVISKDDFPNFGFGFKVISKDDFQEGG